MPQRPRGGETTGELAAPSDQENDREQWEKVSIEGNLSRRDLTTRLDEGGHNDERCY